MKLSSAASAIGVGENRPWASECAEEAEYPHGFDKDLHHIREVNQV